MPALESTTSVNPSLGKNYKWVALSNTTLGVIMAAIDGTAVMLALPTIFNGIKINPLDPSSSTYLLWLLMGYMLVMAVLVVGMGRIGDMFGRTRVYNLGFVVFTVGSLLCSIVWSKGSAGALELIMFRLVQAIGGAALMANSAAIITDAFPVEQRGLALGLNMGSFIVGSFLGIVVGGLLSLVGWRWVFLFNVPIGVFATIWAYRSLKEIGKRRFEPMDWLGNITFAAGLTMVLVGIIYGIEPYGTSYMGWTSPLVLIMLICGSITLVAFVFIELRVKAPMFQLNLFRIRAFATGNAAGFLAAVARGGLMFMVTIWLQAIWLPLHGYDYKDTPLWAGIFTIPMSLGFLLGGPISGRLYDQYGARYFATGGMLLATLTLALMLFLPTNFSYPWFAALVFMNGLSMGLFIAPNMASIMNSLPEKHRGAGSGMRGTIQNTGMPLSMGILFTLMMLGMIASVPAAMYSGLAQNGVPDAVAHQVANLPPTGYLFAALLGYNPLASIIPSSVLQGLPDHGAAITSKTFFPQIISGPFHHGLEIVLIFSTIVCLIAAGVSWLRGGKYVYHEKGEMEVEAPKPTQLPE